MSFSSQINLAGLTPEEGFVFKGEEDSYCGYAVTNVPLNGNSQDNAVFGSYKANNNTGEVYVVFNDYYANITELTPDNLGNNGIIIKGANPDDQFGFSIASVPYINGFAAGIVISAPGAGKGGEVYGVYGTQSPKDFPLPQIIDASNLSKELGFTIEAAEEGEQLGISVADAGKFYKEDSWPDIIIGTAKNKVYLVKTTMVAFTGRFNLANFTSDMGLIIFDDNPDSQFGYSVDHIKSITKNEDGVPQGGVIIGSPGTSTVSVIFNNLNISQPTFNINELNGKNGFVITGDVNDQTGVAINNIPDLNGDGLEEIIIGAPKAKNKAGIETGKGYIVYSNSKGYPANLNLLTLNSSQGLVIETDIAGAELGTSVAGFNRLVSDTPGILSNGVLIGAPGVSSAYVIMNDFASFSGGTINVASLNGTNGFVISGKKGERTGQSVAVASSFQSKGQDAIIIGAPNAGEGGQGYVLFSPSEPDPDPSNKDEGLSVWSYIIDAAIGISVFICCFCCYRFIKKASSFSPLDNAVGNSGGYQNFAPTFEERWREKENYRREQEATQAADREWRRYEDWWRENGGGIRIGGE